MVGGLAVGGLAVGGLGLGPPEAQNPKKGKIEQIKVIKNDCWAWSSRSTSGVAKTFEEIRSVETKILRKETAFIVID